jgi:hypothetical protein
MGDELEYRRARHCQCPIDSITFSDTVLDIIMNSSIIVAVIITTIAIYTAFCAVASITELRLTFGIAHCGRLRIVGASESDGRDAIFIV